MKLFRPNSKRLWLTSLIMVAVSTLMTHAERVRIGDLYYNLYSFATQNTATVTYESTTTGNYSNLSANIVIPDSVEHNNVVYCVDSIADQAFANCVVIESISIPGTVLNVGSAMENSNTLPNTSLSDGRLLPFFNCTSLKEVRFEDGTNPISLGSNCYNYVNDSNYQGTGLFFSCPLEKVYVGRDIVYASYPDRYTTVKFDAHPIRFGYSAFYKNTEVGDVNPLKEVTIGSNVKTLPAYVFYHCNGLESLFGGESLTAIPTYAFAFCEKLPNVVLGDGVTSIEQYAFYQCKTLEHISIGPNTHEIKMGAFLRCLSLSTIEWNTVLETIGDKSFSECESLKSLSIPGSVKKIGQQCFSDCPALKNLIIEDDVKQLEIEITTFYKCAFDTLYLGRTFYWGYDTLNPFGYSKNSLKSVTFGDLVRYIPNYLLSGYKLIDTIKLPPNLTTIGDCAFLGCSGISMVSIPGSVKTIGREAFSGCTSLKDLIFEDGTEELLLDEWGGCENMFKDCPIDKLTLGRNLNYTFESPFLDQATLDSVRITHSVTNIKRDIFNKCPSLKYAEFEPGQQPLKIEGAAGNDQLFENCALESVVLGRDIEYKDSPPFYCCYKLRSVNVTQGVTQIGPFMFGFCESLESLSLPYGLVKIDDDAFNGCRSLTKLVLPPTVETIGHFAFERCYKLDSISLGAYIQSIGTSSFGDCLSNAVCITTPNPPIITPRGSSSYDSYTFTNYNGVLYLQGQNALDAYSTSTLCWRLFKNKSLMIEPTSFRIEGATNICGSRGDTIQLKASLIPSNVTLPYIFWYSTNPEIASVDNNGLVTLHTDIVANDGNTVESEDPAKGVRIIATTLYHEGPELAFTSKDQEGGIEYVEIDNFGASHIDWALPYQVFNLHGSRFSCRIESLTTGIYIIRQGSKVAKVAIR